MKTTKYTRSIKPKPGSKAKERLGVVSVIHNTPETIEDFELVCQQMAPRPTATEALCDLISNVDAFLEGKNPKKIEPASPEYYAYLCRQEANRALAMLNKRDTEEAMIAAMYAVMHDQNAFYASNWEPIVARAVNQKPSSGKGESRKKKWAVELAEHLTSSNPPKTPIPKLLAQIPEGEDEENRYDGYEVYREDGWLKAVNGENEDKLREDSFRTGYLSN